MFVRLYVCMFQFSAAETLMTSIIDEFPNFFRQRKRQILFRISVCLSGFVLGIPMVTQGGSHLLNLVDEAVLGFPLLLIGLMEYLVIIFIYGEFGVLRLRAEENKWLLICSEFVPTAVFCVQ